MSISIVGAHWLKKLLGENDVRHTVIDARARADYQAGHIPGAIWMGWEEWCTRPPVGAAATLWQPGYWGLLEDPCGASFRRRLAATGIALTTPLIVCGDGRSSAGREGRIAWMLMYLGAKDVLVLDGGWGGWSEAGGGVETSEPVLRPGIPQVNVQAERRIDLRALRRLNAAGSLPCMVDTRSANEFWGDCYAYIPRPGRLPASALFNYGDLFESDGTFVSRQKYISLLPAEVKSGRRFIAYCEVGVRAATFALVHEAYTGQVVPVFDGSLMEWSLAPELPVVCG